MNLWRPRVAPRVGLHSAIAMPSSKKLRAKAKREAKKLAASIVVPMSLQEVFESPSSGNDDWMKWSGPGFAGGDEETERDRQLFHRGLLLTYDTADDKTREQFVTVVGREDVELVQLDNAVVTLFPEEIDSSGLLGPSRRSFLRDLRTAIGLVRPGCKNSVGKASTYDVYDVYYEALHAAREISAALNGIIQPYVEGGGPVHTTAFVDVQQSALYRLVLMKYSFGGYKKCIEAADDFVVSRLAWTKATGAELPFKLLSEILFVRGKCRALEGDHKPAILDMRAACAGIRICLGMNWSESLVANLEVKCTALLHVLGRAKVEAGAVRPFFSPNQRRGIEAELGFGRWSQKGTKCNHCGEKPSGLLLCGCRAARYCGRQCQKAHWCEHRDFCTNRQEGGFVIAASELKFREQLERFGGFNIVTDHWGISLVVRDLVDGSIFDMLSDKDAHCDPNLQPKT